MMHPKYPGCLRTILSQSSNEGLMIRIRFSVFYDWRRVFVDKLGLCKYAYALVSVVQHSSIVRVVFVRQIGQAWFKSFIKFCKLFEGYSVSSPTTPHPC